MVKAADIVTKMLADDFSNIAGIRTKSGSVYQVYQPQAGGLRPEGRVIAPLRALYNEKGQFVVRGGVYGRGGVDGAITTTTPVQEVMLRRDALEEFLKRPQKEVLRSVESVTSVRGTVYPCVSNVFEAMGTVECKFLPEQIFMYEGALMVRGRVWGDSRYERGETVVLNNIDSVALKNGSVLNARGSVQVAGVAAQMAPVRPALS